MTQSYIPLYRKYRPQSFGDLVGQEALVKTLSNAINLNRIAHAYLFTGPRGTGKTSTARIFAKSLNCKKGPTIEPCGECSNCVDITNGTSIDVIEIDAASNRKVEDARNLLEKVQFVPASGKFKVYIIDEVHMLTTEAFNTLLKTLEEPPPNLVFILATTEAHKVLNTIISRCQRFDLRRIQAPLIVERMKHIVNIENINISDEALNIIAKRSFGGMRDALSLLDQASMLESQEKKVNEDDILSLLGSISEELLLKISNALSDKDSNELISLIDHLVQMGNEPSQVVKELINHFRNMMLVSTASNAESLKNLVDASEQALNELKAQSEKYEIIEIAQIIGKLSEAERTLKTTTQQHLWLEVALINICFRNDIQVIKELESRIEKLEQFISGNSPMPMQSAPPLSSVLPEYVPPPAKPFDAKVSTKSASPDINSEPKVKTTIQERPTAKIAKEETVTNNYVTKPEPAKLAIAQSNQPLSITWKNLLEHIESVPSRMFFFSLSKPVEVNTEKIVITFASENFVKKAQSKAKIDPLEQAAIKLFGCTPRIIVRTPMPEDDEVLKNQATQASPSQSAQKAILTQKPPAVNAQHADARIADSAPTQKMTKVQEEKIVVSAKPKEPLGKEVEEELNSINDMPVYIELDEQAKIVKDLFNGKVIE